MAARYNLLAYDLTGGGTGALDSYDGALFSDGSYAKVIKQWCEYVYCLDADSAASEDSPFVISPDSNAGDKRWVLMSAKLFPNPSASDQGAATAGLSTVKDCIDAIGSVDATIVFHRGTYTFDTSETVPSNIVLEFENGATLARTTGDEVLTVNSPEHIIAGKRQAITSVGMLAFTNPGTVYPEWWGEIDGTEDEVQINLAISSLLTTGITSKTSYLVKNLSNWDRKRVVLAGKYYIDNPILCEGKEYDSIEADNIILDGENVGEIHMNSGFTGVTRYFDETGDGSATIKAAIMMGARDYGKEGGQFQSRSGVKGLQIFGSPIGDPVPVTQTDHIGIWDEFSKQNIYEDIYFEALGKGLAGRGISGATINRIDSRRCASTIYIYFDVPDIMDEGDYSGSWTGIEEGGANLISNIFSQCNVGYLTDDATTAAIAGIHLYNSGENKLSDIEVYGHFHSLIWENLSGGDHGYRWGSISNFESAQSEGQGVLFKNVQTLNISNMDVVWGGPSDVVTSANIDYTEPVVMFDTCYNITIGSLFIDRKYSTAYASGGESLYLKDSRYFNISSFRSWGNPGLSDDTYPYVYFENSDYIHFNSCQLSFQYNASYRFTYAIVFDNDSGNNVIAGFEPDIDDVDRTTPTTIYSQGLVSWGTNANNRIYRMRDVRFSSSEGATIDVTGISKLRIANAGAQDVTNFTGGYTGQEIMVWFTNTNTTLKEVANSGNFQTDNNSDFTPAGAADTIKFVYSGTNWLEVSRSSN